MFDVLLNCIVLIAITDLHHLIMSVSQLVVLLLFLLWKRNKVNSNAWKDKKNFLTMYT